MRIIYFGTPDLAVPVLKAVNSSRHEVVLVVTQPDRPQGRSKQLMPPPVKICAQKLELPLTQPENINSPEFFDLIKKQRADLILVVAFPILPAALFSLTRCGAVNVHSSLLPKYRGAAPIVWALAEGEKTTGVTLFKLDEKIDHGGVIDRVSTTVGSEETAGELGMRLMELARNLVIKNLDKLDSGKCSLIPQDHSLATKAPKLKKEHGKIDWNMENTQICNHVRAFNPYPICFTGVEGCKSKVLRIHKAEKVEGTSPGPGKILISEDGFPLVGCGKGLLKLIEVQPEGRPKTTGNAFLNGVQDKSQLAFE